MNTNDIFNVLDFYDNDILIDVKNIIRQIDRKFEFIGMGCNRATFRISPNNVIKILLNDFGFNDNSFEARSKKNIDFGIPRSKIILVDDIPLLVMEYIEPVIFDDITNYPEWSDFVDCRQIGYNNKGQLLAYDLA